MKKALILSTLLCFSLAFIAVTPKPAFAATDETPYVPIVLGVTIGLGLILTTIFVSQAGEREEIENKFNPRLGKWTYDEMLATMGQPAASAEGKDSILAEYHNAKNVSVGNTVYHKGNFLAEASSETETQNVTRYYGPRYWLYFDKNKKTLEGWQYCDMHSDGVNTSWYARGGIISFIPAGSGTTTAADSRIAAHAAGSQSIVTGAAAAPKTLEQKIKELKALKDKGLITEEEYKTAKAKLLENAVK